MFRKAFLTIFSLLVLTGFVLELNNLLNGEPKDQAVAAGYLAAILYTLLFGCIFRSVLSRIFIRFEPTSVFTILGIVGAIFIETTIWATQEKLRTSGAAISSNLLLDLQMTLPFYAVLAYLFSRQILKNNFSWPAVALAGGFYELLADGIIGNLFQLNLSGALISPILLPIFVVVYSPIILTPFLILRKDIYPLNNKYHLLVKPAKAVAILPFSIGLGLFLKQFTG